MYIYIYTHTYIHGNQKQRASALSKTCFSAFISANCEELAQLCFILSSIEL